MNGTNNETKAKGAPLIIGIGASAGGLEALQQFFTSMPGNSGLSFVVIQHLSPDYKSLMAEILGKSTDMQVLQAEDGMAVRINTVYLIPPKKNMTIKSGCLQLEDYDRDTVINHPIDYFFNSLAEEQKELAIAVVLSGTGSDGTNGIKRVKEYGGMVIAQEPSSAKFDGMPRSAINTGLTDFILSPQGISDEILNYSNYPTMVTPQQSKEIFSDEDSLSKVFSLLRSMCGMDFTHYKRSTVLRRVERRMVVCHTADLEEYAQQVENSTDEAKALVKEILISVTSFFRDKAAYERLKQTAITEIIKRTSERDPVRVWVAGCSTGEEAYSIAILFQEVLEELQTRRDVKIFATDVDAQAVEQAGKGIYMENIIDDVSPDRLSKYFTKRSDQYTISKDIRKMIIFAPHNMCSDPPFGRLDLISCRNVMIYFQPVLQKNMFSIFHTALKTGGYLFLGKSETATEYTPVFRPVSADEKIYVHTDSGKVKSMESPVFQTPVTRKPTVDSDDSYRREPANVSSEDLYSQFLEKYLPPTVVINEKNEVIHFYGSYSDYLHIAPGKANFNIFNIINEDLSLVASTAINRCRTEQSAVTYSDIAVECPEGLRNISLMLLPITGYRNQKSGLIAMMFREDGAVPAEGVTEKYDIDRTAAQRIADLERELQESQGDLKATIGELETVNEELQATNEELLTANEELQSSNEELQSVNEELYTVNSEFQQKLDELTVVTNDMSNFLSSTMIGILFVDSDLNLRKFTEYIGRDFDIREHDVGRSLQIFGHSFPDEDIVEDARGVLKSLTPIDREVKAMNGRNYTLRIAPYRTVENSIRGLVITIIDSLGEHSDR